VPALWPAWLSPRRIALGAVILLLVDAVLGPLLSPAGLSRAAAAQWPELFTRESLRALAYMFVPAVASSLVCARAAMHGRSAARAALGCLAAGVVFGLVTFVGGYAMLMSMMPELAGRRGGGGEDMFTAMVLPGQVVAFTLSILGLALPVSRSYRRPSCDGVHEALIVTGAWLLTAGTLVRWNGFGLSLRAFVATSPENWSLPCVILGLTMLVTGIVADHHLLTWLHAVRRGEAPGWRIEPLADPDVEVPSLFASRRPAELDALLVLERDAGPLPVARVSSEGSDRRRLLGARLRVVTTAVVLLLAVLPATMALIWPRFRQ
jgi:hypothetical protein